MNDGVKRCLDFRRDGHLRHSHIPDFQPERFRQAAELIVDTGAQCIAPGTNHGLVELLITHTYFHCLKRKSSHALLQGSIIRINATVTGIVGCYQIGFVRAKDIRGDLEPNALFVRGN